MCKRGLVCVLLAAASALPSDPEGWGQQGPDDILVPIAPEKESRSYEKEWYPGKHLSRPGWFPGKAVDEEVVKMLPDGDRDGTPDSIDNAWHRASPAAKHFMEHSALGMLMICTFEADEAVPGPVAAAKEAVLPASREVVCTLSVSSKPVTWLCGLLAVALVLVLFYPPRAYLRAADAARFRVLDHNVVMLMDQQCNNNLFFD
ncbi:hypothetical protein EMIHUDRAFT_227442 [Emiliania huxleyi CCMP1516]|uniref:Uncharacterized protein n=2 Tax=Emiliania huxleyi TaxID=2903 RepID=A0A0D3KIS3_EMIH1|nr:hypothetical protein EMIHUDRAFT_227442 [Emiliania huxleyi CCMP1516]EOD35658.1 hypothetical protein EMIHUDRAFT_227442 [Emiliania huxleyi CCMP1516]|eukprot:XP_005788087.1 hypothetical protein EMIHUDRAFT_227442 [Emiliania huxleyi CCMP1516]